ncbi:MAG TPA: sarcosine oxidase subunit gamma family protein [Alphaproteobacteria bacterium]|nr:sarcosine oxidase subunit gamma family protein [Alphaproteobacteria bacterium]
MAELSRSALHGVLRPGRGGAAGAAGVRIAEQRDLSIVQISVFPGAAGDTAALEAFLGMTLPKPGKSDAAGPRVILWVGPGRWLVVEPGRTNLAAALDRAAQGRVAITDLSHARTVLRLSGPSVRDVIAQGCAIDMHPRAAMPGDCFVTALARHSTVLHIVDAATADVYVYRSFGQDLLEWLLEAAAPYGYETVD